MSDTSSSDSEPENLPGLEHDENGLMHNNIDYSNDDDLSAQNTEILVQFQEITAITDMEQSRQVLEQCEWNLETAVNSQLGGNHVQQNNIPPLPPQLPPRNNITDLQPRGVIGWSYFIISYPFSWFFQTVRSIFSYVWRLLNIRIYPPITDPIVDVSLFTSDYHSKYPIHPTWFLGTYSQAATTAKRELKPLIVYLHCEGKRDTDDFCRNSLSNSNVVEYINTNCIFWACDIKYGEGYRVWSLIRGRNYPLLGVVMLRDSRMTVVGRLEGYKRAQELIDSLMAVITDNEPALIAARLDRENLAVNQLLRAEQDAAYTESLRMDQEKDRRKRQDRERRESLEREEIERMEEEQRQKEEIARQKIEYADLIPDEPQTNSDTVCFAIMLPCGTRLKRTFRKEESIKYLYYYIFCHPESPDHFQVTANFPKREIACKPGTPDDELMNFTEAGIDSNQMLYVYDLDS